MLQNQVEVVQPVFKNLLNHTEIETTQQIYCSTEISPRISITTDPLKATFKK